MWTRLRLPSKSFCWMRYIYIYLFSTSLGWKYYVCSVLQTCASLTHVFVARLCYMASLRNRLLLLLYHWDKERKPLFQLIITPWQFTKIILSSLAKSRGNCCVSFLIYIIKFWWWYINLSFLKIIRLFDGDETVALVADKAAEIAGLTTTHTEDKKSNTETVKWSWGIGIFGYI